MLLATPTDTLPAGAFADHREAALAHCLAGGLTVARRADGWPELLLLRLRSGDGAADAAGTLTLRLALLPPAPELAAALEARGLRAAPVSYERARYRLRLRAPLDAGDAQTGVWRLAALASGALAATAVHLTPQEDELLRVLLADGAGALEVEADLRYTGLGPAAPWLVSAATQPLAAHLAAHLGDAPASADAVAAALLSMPAASPLLRWEALEPGAPAVDETLLVELSRHMLGTLLAPVPADDPFAPQMYALRPLAELPAVLSWDLLVPRRVERSHLLYWSSAELAADLAKPEASARIFPVAPDLDIFGRRDVLAVNYLPTDPAGLREVRVDARSLGAGGVPEYRNLRFSGAAEVASFSVTYAATAGFQLDYRVTCVLAPPNGAGWPVLLKGDFRPADGAVIAVDAAGVELARAEAEPLAFERCAAVDVEVCADGAPAASLRLTPERPRAWAALTGSASGASLTARCTAHPPAGMDAPPLALAERPLSDRVARVAAAELEVIEPDTVTISVAADCPPCAYLGVELASADGPAPAEGKRLTLEPGVPRTWRVFRASVFAPPRFRYRLHYVALDAEGRTLPLASTEWREGEGQALVVRP